MASPKTMFSGTIQLGLINIPITIGKATGDDREKSLIEVAVNTDGTIERIHRNERVESGKTEWQKKLAVEIDGGFKILSEDDLEEIDEADGGSTIQVIDVQPASKLPLLYSTGSYYVRHNDGVKMSPDAMATLAAAMMVERLALVVKWKRKLCAITAERGILIMRVLPYLDNVRVASKKERGHMSGNVDPKAVEKLGELLNEIRNPEGFDYAGQHDDGLKHRQAVVDRIIKGEKPKRKAPPKSQVTQTDIFQMIDAAIADVRG